MSKKVWLLSLVMLILLTGCAKKTPTSLLPFDPEWTVAQVQAIIKNGADTNAKDDAGWTPLMHAARYNASPAVVAELIQSGANATPAILMIAVMNDAPAPVVSALIEAGVDVNTKDLDGWSQLMAAAIHGQNPEVIHILLQAGANGKERSPEGKTAFDYATENEWLKGTDAYQALAAAAGEDVK